METLSPREARWSAEHGHWRKNVEAWRAAHEEARVAADVMVELIRRFEAVAVKHELDLVDHESEVRERACAGATAARHAQERFDHARLWDLHRRIQAQAELVRRAFPHVSDDVVERVLDDAWRDDGPDA